jgi:hypothetical protein
MWGILASCNRLQARLSYGVATKRMIFQSVRAWRLVALTSAAQVRAESHRAE